MALTIASVSAVGSGVIALRSWPKATTAVSRPPSSARPLLVELVDVGVDRVDVLAQPLALGLEAPRGVERPDDQGPPLLQPAEDLDGDPVDGPLDAADVLGAVPLDRDGLAEHRRRRHRPRRSRAGRRARPARPPPGPAPAVGEATAAAGGARHGHRREMSLTFSAFSFSAFAEGDTNQKGACTPLLAASKESKTISSLHGNKVYEIDNPQEYANQIGVVAPEGKKLVGISVALTPSSLVDENNILARSSFGSLYLKNLSIGGNVCGANILRDSTTWDRLLSKWSFPKRSERLLLLIHPYLLKLFPLVLVLP